MTRWNVKSIFFMGVGGALRLINLDAEAVNIITGASGTGKSALIKALDYCLGASECELPIFVRRRCTAVGVKWVAGSEEMIVGRPVPESGTSSIMFATSGRNLPIPASLAEFEGRGTVAAVKSFLERAFGIGDQADDQVVPGAKPRGRVTVRQVTPYLFVTKEVIYSETVLLHGLDDKDKADAIVASIPYFLRATSEATAAADRRLRQLRKALEVEEAKEVARATADSLTKQRARLLLGEAARLDLGTPADDSETEQDLIARLRSAVERDWNSHDFPSDGQVSVLHDQRRSILEMLNRTKREHQASLSALKESEGFRGAVNRQNEKLLIAEHLELGDIPSTCPVCEAHTELGAVAARALRNSIDKVRAESGAVERVQPRMQAHANHLAEEAQQLAKQLRQVDLQITSALEQVTVGQRLAGLAEVQAHFKGRVSYFLGTISDEMVRPIRDLDGLRGEIAELESGLDREARDLKLRHAESAVSRFASEIFKVLPKVAPCVGAELLFSARKPSINIVEPPPEGSVLGMPDVGSDQNYLAVHIALSFALQRHFETVESPVPGLIVLDQISRPYFPASIRDTARDEREIAGEDEEFQAMRRHINFLFEEVATRRGLQVLLIEHAYFADDARYVAATKERWTRTSGNALIPSDWPTRSKLA